MEHPIENYWEKRLEALKNILETNNFEVHIADNRSAAKTVFWQDIFSKTDVRTVSWGGSMTFIATGLYDELKSRQDLVVLDTFDKSISREDATERRRQALLADMFITGTNAITESGQLVNLDMTGNRVAALVFGPKQVVILAGRNKIVPDLDEAMFRIKDYVAPVNAMRLDKKTPCVKTSYCEECKSTDRICNSWVITEKAFPKGRIKVILINENMGF
ncbi:MAG: lactate utilization protein [Deltaproteobacteria bacterium]|nr:lactate utilization protein [Deltaproteobacteria bacterium]MBW1961794.1 lactate utilization protein [Deltaproteobacteria bacterium]MBW1993453.1 lactate utilization protein [Deltaproteobacteria bacterium]MBW2152459.1 lactate utilization protein [Deltaproteobacteria bacterium]